MSDGDALPEERGEAVAGEKAEPSEAGSPSDAGVRGTRRPVPGEDPTEASESGLRRRLLRCLVLEGATAGGGGHTGLTVASVYVLYD